MNYKLYKNDGIEIVFADGVKTASAFISQERLKELLIEKAYEIITKPECNCSSCAENNFCECDPINEDMEFAGMFVSINLEIKKRTLNHFENWINKESNKSYFGLPAGYVLDIYKNINK